MKDLVFYFEFANDADDEEVGHSATYGFVVKKMFYEEEDDIEVMDFAYNMEELYGIHDWASSPAKEVHGIGFTSYEVETKNHLELMEKWRQFFVRLCFTVTDIVRLDNSGVMYLDDYGIYQEIMRKI